MLTGANLPLTYPLPSKKQQNSLKCVFFLLKCYGYSVVNYSIRISYPFEVKLCYFINHKYCVPKLKVFLKLHTYTTDRKKMLGGIRELLAHLLLDLFKGFFKRRAKG